MKISRFNFNGLKQSVEYCDVSGKVCYDKKSATTAQNHRWKMEHTKIRIYPCPDCQRAGRKAWHLTAQMKGDEDEKGSNSYG